MKAKHCFLLVLLLVPLTIVHSFLSFTCNGVSGRASSVLFFIISRMLKLATPELLPEQGNNILNTENNNNYLKQLIVCAHIWHPGCNILLGISKGSKVKKET